MNPIPFNKPYITGNEDKNIHKVIQSRRIAGDGNFTIACQKFFESKYNMKKCLLTTSCTDALEMTSLLANIKCQDEIIMPSYTFVSTANPFLLRGAKIIFADSEYSTPNIDVNKIEELITPATKAIVIVHYAGVACDMDRIMSIASKYNLLIIEDAAHSINSFYKEKPLGTIGQMAAFSFHESKNVTSGEGGMLVINDKNYIQRAEIIREKGTNRSQFFRGEIDKYGWMDLGSSFLPSELIAAFLYAQLEMVDKIQQRRIEVWNRYMSNLKSLQTKHPELLPQLPSYATNNAHMYYLRCSGQHERTNLIKYLAENNINAVFHYLPLHISKMFEKLHDGRNLQASIMWSECLVRLPLFVELKDEEVDYVSEKILKFYNA